MTEPETSGTKSAGARVAWVPLPLFAAAMAAAWWSESNAAYDSQGTLLVLNFLFSTISGLVVAFLIGRSFLLRGEPGLLLMGSGVLLFGITGLFSTVAGGRDANDNVTIHNLGICLASLSCLSGALVSLKPRPRLRNPVAWLAATYSAAPVVLSTVAIVTVSDWMPVFFVQGTGGTPLRQAVLGSTIAMFAFTAVLLRGANRGALSAFLHWYTLGLLLIATGLSGVLAQPSFGSVIGWVGRAAQYFGGIYILVAAVVSVRDARDWEISLEGSLAEARQRYAELFDIAADGILLCVAAAGGECRIARANAAACELLGYAAGGIRDLDLAAIVTPEERASLPAAVDSVLRAGVLRYETTLLAHHGRRIAADINMRQYRDGGRQMIMAVIRDITDRKRAEEQVRELSQRLSYHVDNSPLAVIEWGADMRLTRWSRAAERVFGWKAEEVLGKRMEDFPWIHPDDAAQVSRIAGALAIGGVQNFSANRNQRKDGSVVHCEWYNSSLADNSGTMRSTLSLVLDVTARRQAEEKLVEAKRLLDALLENVPEGITIARAPDLRVELSSRYGVETFGAFRVGVPVPDTISEWRIYASDGVSPLPDEERPLVRAIRRGETVRDLELVAIHPDGRRIPLLCNATPIHDENGAVIGGVAAWRDLTERKRAEERLLHSQKLESIGLLAGGIAHDFNNLLVGVIGNASLAQDMISPDDPVSELLEHIVKSGEHAAHLTRQMLAYSGKGRFVVERVEVSRLAADIVTLVKPSIPRRVTVQLDLAPDLPPLMADAGQIQQVIMNLVINAGEAIGDRAGLVTLRTRLLDLDVVPPGEFPAGVEPDPGRYLVIEVRDTGCGMDAATRSRIFDPFFSTKFTGRGLGLAAVSGIMRGHKGAIRVRSAPGEGSCFEALFPVQDIPLPDKRPAAPDTAATAPSTVLVVDDEEVVLQTSRRALETAGFHVLTAVTGEQALETLSREPAVAAVLLDLSMPGMDGVEALERMREFRPALKAIVSSGFSEEETMRLFHGMEVAGFLQKPYTAHRVVVAVRSALA
jgi:two-component system, cell cycle sensor histidine kinase and response regulator CckA